MQMPLLVTPHTPGASNLLRQRSMTGADVAALLTIQQHNSTPGDVCVCGLAHACDCGSHSMLSMNLLAQLTQTSAN